MSVYIRDRHILIKLADDGTEESRKDCEYVNQAKKQSRRLQSSGNTVRVRKL